MRCFLIVGPESSGNRLLAATLIRAGCVGDASTAQWWDRTLPDGVSDAVVIRSFPHGDDWPDLGSIYADLTASGYDITTLVTVRHPAAVAKSQASKWPGRDQAGAMQVVREAYRRIFADIQGNYFMVPYEAVIAGGQALAALLNVLGLPEVTTGALYVDGVAREVGDENVKHF